MQASWWLQVADLQVSNRVLVQEVAPTPSTHTLLLLTLLLLLQAPAL